MCVAALSHLPRQLAATHSWRSSQARGSCARRWISRTSLASHGNARRARRSAYAKARQRRAAGGGVCGGAAALWEVSTAKEECAAVATRELSSLHWSARCVAGLARVIQCWDRASREALSPSSSPGSVQHACCH